LVQFFNFIHSLDIFTLLLEVSNVMDSILFGLL
jgi:hypothetical protein